MRRPHSRGLSLGTTLLVALILMSLGFALSGASVSHLHLTVKTNNSNQAENLARSAVNVAISRVFQDQTFGAAGNSELIQIPGPEEGSVGYITFDREQADNLGIPHSTNNLMGVGSTLGWGNRVVPATAVHLVAVGRCNGSERRLEVVLVDKGFPYAIASDGPILSEQGLIISGEDSEGTEAPADIHSNAPLSEAITLGGQTSISGDVQAVGTVIVQDSPSVMIDGLVRNGEPPVSIERFDIQRLDPENLERPVSNLSAQYSNRPTVMEGLLRRTGDLTIAGDLELSGLLYVNGDMEVTGGVRGEGIIVTTGSLRVRGLSVFQAGSRLGILCQGRLELLGQGSSSVKGLLYTESGFKARQISVEGALLAPGMLEDLVDLENVEIRHRTRPDLDFEIKFPPGVPQIRTIYIYNDPPSRPLVASNELDENLSLIATVTFSYDGNDLFSADIAARSFNPISYSMLPVEELQTHVESAITLLGNAPINLSLFFANVPTEAEATPPPLMITLEPSEFLTFSERARIALWREF